MKKTNYWRQDVKYPIKATAQAYLLPPKKKHKKGVVFATGCDSCGPNPPSCDSCGGGASECE